MSAIQFETVVVGNTIRIPDQYTSNVPSTVKVTLVPAAESKMKFGARSKAGMLSPKDFSAVRIDTKSFVFDREEANER
jgi:hypothetical protein